MVQIKKPIRKLSSKFEKEGEQDKSKELTKALEKSNEKEEVVIEAAEEHLTWEQTLKPIVLKQKSASTKTEGAITVINDRNSKRVKLKQSTLEALEYPDNVKFYVTDNEFVLQASAPDDEGAYKLRVEGKHKSLIYNTELVNLLTKMFELDFTESTSQTFGKVVIQTVENKKYAVIR